MQTEEQRKEQERIEAEKAKQAEDAKINQQTPAR